MIETHLLHSLESNYLARFRYSSSVYPVGPLNGITFTLPINIPIKCDLVNLFAGTRLTK